MHQYELEMPLYARIGGLFLSSYLIKVITTVRVCGYSDFDEQKLQAFQKRLSKHGISTEHGAGEVS